MREVVDLRNEHLRRLLEIGIELIRATLELQFLYGQLHRCERVVDLVRYLPRHRAPCALALRFRQLLRTLLYPIDQHIIALHQRTEFVVVRIVDMIVLFTTDGESFHLLRQQRDRRRHRLRRRKREEQRQEYHHQIRWQEVRQQFVHFRIACLLAQEGRHGYIADGHK